MLLILPLLFHEKECVVKRFISFFFFQIPTQSFSVLLPGVCLRNISRFFAKKIIFFSIVSLLPFFSSAPFRSRPTRYLNSLRRNWKVKKVEEREVKFERKWTQRCTIWRKNSRSIIRRSGPKSRNVEDRRPPENWVRRFFFFLKDSIRRLAKEKKEEERNKRIGSRLTKEMFFRTCFSENGVFRAEERGLVGWGYAEWRNLPFLGDLHQT